MMKRFLHVVLTWILLLTAQGFTRAGIICPNGIIPWDELLDQYESICLQCLDLRSRQDAGQPISTRQLQGLLHELEQLREQLREATDKMPAAARYRFEAIRRMYASGKRLDTHPPKIDFKLVPVNTVALRAPYIPFSPDRRPTPTPPPVIQPGWVLSASAIVLPEPAWGLRISRLGRRWGGYAAFHSNFSCRQTVYDALSDGFSENTRIWTSGASATDCVFITTGPSLRLSKQWVLSAGLGYGQRKLCWEDSEGNWMRITDASPSGLCTELGVTFLWRKISFSTSWISLPFSYHALSLSAGYCF